ncbi:MAM and LDL-receptor class A domain-containing protein 1 [Aplochiton taeniatus]
MAVFLWRVCLLASSILSVIVCVNVCSTEAFTCAQGSCVAEDCVCDFTDDCGDGSDEKNCSGYVRCDFEKGFCGLTPSSETHSKWMRTTGFSNAGPKHDHANNPSDGGVPPPPPVCPLTWFSCASGECIDKSKVCDFIPHCPHGEDEASCPSHCDFEGDSCGWSELTLGDGFDWVRGCSARVPPDYQGLPPPLDHSTNSTEGNFMFVLKNSSSLFLTAVLEGPQFQQAASGCTMTFWHYNSGISVGAADMLLWIAGVENPTVLWRTFYNQGRSWNKVTLQLGRIRQPFHISLYKLSLGVFDGVSALDDITFENCSLPPAAEQCPGPGHFHCARSRACVEPLQLCDLVDDCGDGSDEEGCAPELQCDFEQGLCSWSQERAGGDEFDWTRIQGPTPTFKTGPSKDHTLGTANGHYLFIESSAPQEFKDTAVLVSRAFQPTLRQEQGSACVFRFHFHMFGSHVYRLAVYQRTTDTGRGHMLWVRYGNLGDLWHRKTLFLTSARPFQILVEGTVGDDFNGDIAIDDLSFLHCVPYEGDMPSVNPDPPSTTPQAPTVQPHSCPEGQFVCGAAGECVNRARVCDFRHDCSDGSDEMDCVREVCDFEGGDCCGWTRSSPLGAAPINAFCWLPDQGDTLHEGEEYHRPLIDHTLGSREGWYIYADSSNGGYGNTTDYQTPVISSTGPQCTLVFWYYMSGFTVGSLQVLLKHGNDSYLVWSETGNQGEIWRRGEVYLGISSNFQVVLRAKRGISYMGDVVVDDVTFQNCAPPLTLEQPCGHEEYACSNGHCIPADNLCDFIDHCGDNSDEDPYICKGFIGRCSFEFDLCSWRQNWDDEFDWLIKAGSTRTIGTGPSTDHTLRNLSGHYLYLESSFPQAAGDHASISGPLMSSRSKECKMRFYLHMSGVGIGAMAVLQKTDGQTRLLLNVTGNQGNYWQSREIQLSSPRDFQVLFLGKIGPSAKGDICLDDITFSPGCLLASTSGTGETTPSPPTATCPLGSLQCENGQCFTSEQRCDFTDDCGDGTDEKDCGTSCTFENGRCGWKSSLADIFDWTWGTGSVHGVWPPYDHTFLNEKGHFVYLEATAVGLKGDKAHMKSSLWRESGAICKLSFWYYISHKASGTIRLLVQTENELTEVWNKTGHQGNQWNHVEVPLRKLRSFQVIFEGIRSWDLSGGAALDDLEFRDCAPGAVVPESCPTATDFVCQSGHCIESHLVCDNKADCSDESDEMDCSHIRDLPGSCNFDMPADQWEETCQLSQDLDDDCDWRIGQGRVTSGTGPPADHSPGGVGHFLFIRSATGREGDIAMVTTRTPFPASVGLCHLRFWFCMHGSDSMGTLKVYTVGPSGTRLLMWAASGNHGDHWVHASVLLSNVAPFRVTFQAEVGGDMWTDIALDDVSFTSECTVGGPVTPEPLTCGPEQFQCVHSFQCVHETWRCDGEMDCADQSDEEQCPGLVPGTLPPQDRCRPDQYQCSDHRCVPSLLRCDGAHDCPHGEDEYSCPLPRCKLGEIVCEDPARCIPLQERCDHTVDCPLFQSDESSCHECPPMYCLDRGSCHVGRHGPMCTCDPGWTGNRCHVKDKSSPATLPPQPEDTWQDAVYAGVATGLVLVITVVSLGVLFMYLKRRRFLKPNLMNYGIMDNLAFGRRAEVSGPNDQIKIMAKRPRVLPFVAPRRSDGPGLSISVYPWRKDVEAPMGRDANLSFPNPLYQCPLAAKEGDSSEA